MEEERAKSKVYERLGVMLVILSLLLIGIILLQDKSEPAQFVPATESAETQSIPTSVKAATDTTISGKINVNKASVEDLDRLPGIGAILAQRIIEYRKANGGFKNLEEIKNVSGIGEAKYNKIRGDIEL